MRLAMLVAMVVAAVVGLAGGAVAPGDGGYYSVGHGVNLQPLADRVVGVGLDGAYGVWVDESTGHVFVGSWAGQSTPLLGDWRSLDVHADAQQVRARLDGGLHAEPPLGSGAFGGQGAFVVVEPGKYHAQTQGQLASGTPVEIHYGVCVNALGGGAPENSGVSLGAGPVATGQGSCDFFP